MELIAKLFFFAIYLLITITVITITTVWAIRKQRRHWLWGSLAAVLMYNFVFWDLVPTLVLHKYYCDTQAGFFVYKTPEQWKIENPNLTIDDLKPLGNNKEMLWDFPVKTLIDNPSKKVVMINQRIYLDGSVKRNILYPIPIHKTTQFIADYLDNKKLAELVTFSGGYGSMWTSEKFNILQLKLWLAKNYCGNYKAISELERDTGYRTFIKKIIEAGE